MHNPRAEAARAEGCSFERVFDIMKEDDAFDAPLTELGKDQAQRGEARFGKYLRDAELLVASPLSRALQTADLMLPPAEAAEAASAAGRYLAQHQRPPSDRGPVSYTHLTLPTILLV